MISFAQIAAGFDFYRRIGTTAMSVQSLDVTPLDEYHTMAKVHWQARHRTTDGAADTIDFDVIYFLQDLGAGPKVFAHVTGDKQESLRERGLISMEESQ
jgi:hypothetical protein